MTGSRTDAKWLTLLSILTMLAPLTSCGGNGTEGDAPLYPSQNWTLAEEILEIPGIHSQGLATLPALGPSDLVFTSRFTIDRTRDGDLVTLKWAISPESWALGFDHLGDPDAYGTLVYGGLEDNSDPVVDPFHRGFAVFDAYTLDLMGWSNDPGQADQPGDGDAPWVAVSPDGTWLVTGEWNPMQRLILYRAETLVAQSEVESDAVIPLDGTIRSVQGCDFDGPLVLVCASDDEDAGRFVYAIFLSKALQGGALPEGLTAHVEPLFPAPVPEPLCELCDEPQEVEGVDVDGDTLRVLVLGPCLLDSHLYRYGR